MPGTMTAPPASITSAFDRSISSFAPMASMRPSAMATLTARRSESDEPSARAASCRIVRLMFPERLDKSSPAVSAAGSLHRIQDVATCRERDEVSAGHDKHDGNEEPRE